MAEERPVTLPPHISLEQARRETAYWQRMDLDEKVERFFEWNDLQRMLIREIIRRRRPEYSEPQIHLATARLLFGNELFVKAFGEHDVWP